MWTALLAGLGTIGELFAGAGTAAEVAGTAGAVAEGVGTIGAVTEGAGTLSALGAVTEGAGTLGAVTEGAGTLGAVAEGAQQGSFLADLTGELAAAGADTALASDPVAAAKAIGVYGEGAAGGAGGFDWRSFLSDDVNAVLDDPTNPEAYRGVVSKAALGAAAGMKDDEQRLPPIGRGPGFKALPHSLSPRGALAVMRSRGFRRSGGRGAYR